MTEPRIMIVTPVLDDWEAFQRLVAALARGNAGGPDRRFDLLVVDDGSNSPFELEQLTLPPGGAIRAVTMIRLALNLGHQRAIAVGLTEAALRDDIEIVVVMDSDGEDRPEDIPALLDAHRAAPDAVIFAQRARRSESMLFKAGVFAYRVLFRVLAQQSVEFGNFSLVPIAAVRRLCHMPDLWNNLSATVLRSRLPYRLVPTARGRRYAGSSKMNWNGLVIHGLSAMSVYSDVIFVRLMMAAAAIGAVALLGIVIAIVIRFATDLATPGWASTVVGVFMILLVQMLAATAIAALALLGARSRRPFVPKTDCAQFIAARETIAASPG
jgi:polyisoprenyl-phosphate glycosyltransferase